MRLTPLVKRAVPKRGFSLQAAKPTPPLPLADEQAPPRVRSDRKEARCMVLQTVATGMNAGRSGFGLLRNSGGAAVTPVFFLQHHGQALLETMLAAHKMRWIGV
jgi:hypothetical protein